jgi:hypothetical protein
VTISCLWTTTSDCVIYPNTLRSGFIDIVPFNWVDTLKSLSVLSLVLGPLVTD